MARQTSGQVEVAGLLPRLAAWCIDLSVPVLLGLLMRFVAGSVGDPTALLVVMLGLGILQAAWALLLWWGYGSRGAGIGFRVMKLELVNIADGRPIGWWRYFLRQLVWAALFIPVLPGIAMLVFLVIHERRRGWHDLAGHSLAIKRRVLTAKGARPVPAQQRKAPSTTVALPPHLIAKAFDGTSQPEQRSVDPAEVARQQQSFGEGRLNKETSWQPPAAPGSQIETTRLGRSAPSVSPQPSAPPAPHQSVQPQNPLSATPAAHAGPPTTRTSKRHRRPSDLEDLTPEVTSLAASISPQSPVAHSPVAHSPVAQSPASQGSSAQPFNPAAPDPGSTTLPTARRQLPDEPMTVMRPAGGPVDDGATVLRPRRQPAPEEQGTVLSPRSLRPDTEGWYLVMDDGRRIELSGVVVIGRKPSAPSTDPSARLVPAGEGGNAVSKNHLQVGLDPRGVWVQDIGSTNGTAIVDGRGQFEPCPPHTQVRLREGQVVSFGDRSLTLRRTPLTFS